MEIMQYIRENKLSINVKANSPKNKIVAWDSDKNVLKVEIRAPAENNKANVEIIKFFSKLLKKDVKIISGLTSKHKILRLSEK